MTSAPPPTILLLGPRAAGKTSVGRALAARLGRPFIDLDDRVRDRFDGRTVSEIWKAHGESAWRLAEGAALDELLSRDRGLEPAVIALGGGAPTVAAVREAIAQARAAGRVVTLLLLPSIDVLTKRLARQPGDRPSLTGGGVADEASTLLAARLPVYRSLADLELATDDPRVERNAERAAALLASS
ncbi:MAG: shikimate kinase [Phycisphaerales bacterium]